MQFTNQRPSVLRTLAAHFSHRRQHPRDSRQPFASPGCKRSCCQLDSCSWRWELCWQPPPLLTMKTQLNTKRSSLICPSTRKITTSSWSFWVLSSPYSDLYCWVSWAAPWRRSLFYTITATFIGLYIKVADCWRRNCVVCPCSYGRKKQGLARQLQGQSVGQTMALNPSTDPLVSHTQYAPVSEVPRLEDEEERKTLMHDKDWWVVPWTLTSLFWKWRRSFSSDYSLSTAEESQLLGPDPRIVLRPSTQVDDA